MLLPLAGEWRGKLRPFERVGKIEQPKGWPRFARKAIVAALSFLEAAFDKQEEAEEQLQEAGEAGRDGRKVFGR